MQTAWPTTPGQAVLPGNWVQSCQERGLEVPVRYAYEAAFRLWCSQVLPPLRVGQINLKGMHPLVKAELQWGLFAHTQHQEHTRWSLRTLQRGRATFTLPTHRFLI